MKIELTLEELRKICMALEARGDRFTGEKAESYYSLASRLYGEYAEEKKRQEA